MATAEITVIGLGRASASASEYIAEIQRRLAAQDKVGYRLGAMGTELEGSLDDILAVVRDLHRVPLEVGLPRAYTVLKLDERADKPEQSLVDKVESVQRRLAGEAAEVGPELLPEAADVPAEEAADLSAERAAEEAQ